MLYTEGQTVFILQVKARVLFEFAAVEFAHDDAHFFAYREGTVSNLAIEENKTLIDLFDYCI